MNITPIYWNNRGQLNLQEIEAIQKKFDVEKDLLVKDLSDQHAKEEYTLHQANQLAVATLRETLEQQSQERVEQARLRHEREIEEMREELLSEHKKNEKKLCEEHRMNLHRHQREMEKLLAERTTEVCYITWLAGGGGGRGWSGWRREEFTRNYTVHAFERAKNYNVCE